MKLLNKIKSSIFRLIESIIRNVSGSLGIKVRRLYYKHKLAKCGKNLIIDEGVIVQGAESMYIGDNVWIDKYCILMTGEIKGIDSKYVKKKKNFSFIKRKGALYLGSNSYLGIRTIIQAYAGVEIGDYFTSAVDCKIYSFSNDVKMCRYGTVGLDNVYFIDSPIKIRNNVWLGFNCIVVGGTLGSDIFVMPNSIVINDICDNAIAGGFPAKKIKNRFSTSILHGF